MKISDMTCVKVWLNWLPPYVQNSVRLEGKKRKMHVSETCYEQPAGMIPSCIAPYQQQRLNHYGIRIMPSADTNELHSYLSSI
jgi:hypothetical protein